jgi:hypothetical protein
MSNNGIFFSSSLSRLVPNARRSDYTPSPTGPVKATAEGIIAARRKATGEKVEELPDDIDPTAAAIIRAYERALKGD